MAVINQWGKRSSTDAPFAEPEAQRRRLDENSSSSNTSSDNPSVKSRALSVSPFEQLPDEVTHHLLRKMDDRTQGALACTSKMFAQHIDRVRWDQAGSPIEDWERWGLRPLDDYVQSWRGTEKLRGNLVVGLTHNQGLNQPAAGQAPLTDHEIGFQLGCRHPHIRLIDVATPQLMAGLSAASHWRSLWLTINLDQYSLSELLEPLIQGLGEGFLTAPRELLLEIHGHWKHTNLEVPDALWSGRLQLAGLDFNGFDEFQKMLCQFDRATALRYLHAVAYDDLSTASVLNAIGSHFPMLQAFTLTSNESTWVQDNSCLTDFQRSHPCLQRFTLEFDESLPDEFRADFSGLDVRHFRLWTSRFIDTDGTFADWIKTNQRLEELNLEVNLLNANEGADFRRLAKAVGANKSLRKLSVAAISQSIFEDSDEGDSVYEQCLIDLLEGISSNTHLAELAFSLDFRDFLESKHATKWQVVRSLELLESVNPGLIFEIGYSLDERNSHKKAFGAGVMVSSVKIEIPAGEYIARFGWGGAEQIPGAEDSVEFQVEMPTWGQGAFRKFVTYSRMRYEEKKQYILDSLVDGSLSKENIRILGVIPSMGLQQRIAFDEFTLGMFSGLANLIVEPLDTSSPSE